MADRVVYGCRGSDDVMGYKYRARIVKTRKGILRRRDAWQFIIDRHFVGWETYHTSSKYSDEILALAQANDWLNWRSTLPGTVVKDGR
jgi:hypothetical protein